MEIKTVRARTDNYCYLVVPPGSKTVAVVDPSEAAPISRALEQGGFTLGLILNTHHHHDHVGGNQELHAKWRCPVYCSARDFERVPEATRGLDDGQTFMFENLEFKVISIPGHTEGQIAYHVGEALFVGDTVFEMGCGRLFEGTAAQLFSSIQKIKRLPAHTRLFVGHEYTEANARFAKMMDPQNAAVERRLDEVRDEIQRAGHARAPTIEQEQAVNPFFRAANVTEFARLRELRNTFQ